MIFVVDKVYKNDKLNDFTQKKLIFNPKILIYNPKTKIFNQKNLNFYHKKCIFFQKIQPLKIIPTLAVVDNYQFVQAAIIKPKK